jgi:hypothetical protein
MKNTSKSRHLIVGLAIWTTMLALLLNACSPANLSGSAGMDGENPTDELVALPPLEEPPTNTPEPTDVIATLPSLEVASSTPTPIPPDFALGLMCSANAQQMSVTISNHGGAMLTAGTYTVLDPNTNQSTTSNFQLAADGQISFTAVGNAKVTLQYGTVTLAGTGTCMPQPTATHTPTRTSTPTKTPTPQPAPNLIMSISCTANLRASFAITNQGGSMPTFGTYTILNPNSGQSTTSNFQLTALGELTFKTAGNARVTVQYGTQTLQATATCTPQPTATRTPTLNP